MPCVDFTRNMQVVVLVGGLGTRLGELTGNMPKPMVGVHGKPFFLYMLELLKWHGFRQFHFCIGYQGKAIKKYFGNGDKFGVHITYSSDETKLLGTAGALRNALAMLEEDFLLIYGDSYMDIGYNELVYRYIQLKKQGHKKAIMAIFQNNDRYDKSNVLFKNGRIIAYDKKNPTPDMQHIDYGISVLNKKLIAGIPRDQVADLASLYNKTAREGSVAAYPIRKRFYEIGTPTSLTEFRKFVQKRNQGQKAVILDRDGTLNEIVFDEDTEHFDSPLCEENVRIIPKICEALRILRSLGYLLIVVTNQPAAAKGKTTLSRLYDINNRMNEILGTEDITLDDILMCPHHPTGNNNFCSEPSLIHNCPGRKPSSLLLKEAIEKHNVDIEQSFMVGDSYVDVLAGGAQQLKTAFIGRFKCDCCQLLGKIKPSLVFHNLYQFAKFLKDQKNENC